MFNREWNSAYIYIRFSMFLGHQKFSFYMNPEFYFSKEWYSTDMTFFCKLFAH